MKNPVRTKENFLVFGAPALDKEELAEVADCFKRGWLGTGPKVAEFEEAFRAYRGTRHAAAVNSCTAALHLSLLAIGLKPGDEVITTAMTFCATVNAIIHSGAVPVLADIDPVTMNIDPDDVERRITPRTRAILPVHFAGRPCNMDALVALAHKHGLVIVEDCAHAIETTYHGRPAGTFGRLGCFSFYVTKNIVTGEGGMVLTDDDAMAARIKILALHGMSKDAWKRFSDEGYRHYEVVECGFKYNMMDVQAAIGLPQLRKVESFLQRRSEIWRQYEDAFSTLPVTRPAAPEPDTRHALHLYTLLIDPQTAGLTRDKFLAAMTAHNIGIGVHYRAIPEHPYYQQQFGWLPEMWPQATRVGRQTVSLPLSPKLTNTDVEDVIQAVRLCLNR